MAKNLIIVESPNKINKIQSFLDSDYKVIASVGHIRDLKKYGTRLRLGIDLDEMQPIYEIISNKKKVIKEINSEAKKAENIYLATDPDREGEAISWHINEIIDDKENKKIYRTSFNEITKDSVINSIQNPTKLNYDLVYSQEARRMLDRIIGFRLSFITQKKLKAQSAGRVKSSTLKLIIDRENEIKSFVPEYWWTIEGEVSKEKNLINVKKDYKEQKYSSKEEAEKVLKELKEEFQFIERKEKDVKIVAPKPLEMATLLMGLYNTFGMSNAQVTSVSQSLYEKGFISYPRTDSTRISSKEFIDSTTKYIENEFGSKNFRGLTQPKTNKNDQDAHEAIRPTSIEMSPFDNSTKSDLTAQELKVYEYIWKTTLKAFMIDGQNSSVSDFYENNHFYFKLKYSYVVVPGFRLVDKIIEEKSPKIEKNIKIDLSKINVIDHSTKPPARYNQASIIKKMKDEGIGRPSTYSSTTTGLVKYGYLDKEKGVFIPTEIAYEVNDLLLKKFSDIVNEKYTALLETKLDEIANGTLNEKDFLKDFWKEFEPRVEEADKTVEVKLPEYVGKKCPRCEIGELVYKRSRYGKFIGCDRYPECKYMESIEKKDEPIETDILCPNCGSKMVIKKSKYNTLFVACPNFPKCKTILPKEDAAPIIEKYTKKD